MALPSVIGSFNETSAMGHGLEIFADKLHGLGGFAYRLQGLERFPGDPNILESYAEGLHVVSSSEIFTDS